MPASSDSPSSPLLHWDIFCRVIDNFGDIGVCWRLCTDLADRGCQVRLFVDDASALSWMAPQGHASVQVLPWPDETQPNTSPIAPISCDQALGDVVIEAFGCELPLGVQALIAQQPRTVWINLEYLSAESFVERAHGLPSPVMNGPAKGATKWFFYPGFTARTGGLLREQHLLQRQTSFDAHAWRQQLLPSASPSALWISVFCYDSADLQHLMASFLTMLAMPREVHWLITPGKAQIAFEAAYQGLHQHHRWPKDWHVHQLDYTTQPGYDHLLWACDLNIVRGEDSLVRALWSGRAFIWQIYPQDDLAHHDKLTAFLDTMNAPDLCRRLHALLNNMTIESAEPHEAMTNPIDTLTAFSQEARKSLLDQYDLTHELIGFTYNKGNKPQTI